MAQQLDAEREEAVREALTRHGCEYSVAIILDDPKWMRDGTMALANGLTVIYYENEIPKMLIFNPDLTAEQLRSGIDKYFSSDDEGTVET